MLQRPLNAIQGYYPAHRARSHKVLDTDKLKGLPRTNTLAYSRNKHSSLFSRSYNDEEEKFFLQIKLKIGWLAERHREKEDFRFDFNFFKFTFKKHAKE